MEFARKIAEAEIDLRRIRRARAAAEKIAAPPRYFKTIASPDAKLRMKRLGRAKRHKNASIEDLTRMPAEAGSNPEASRLVDVPVKQSPRDRRGEAFARYERRALSRRKSAIRAFDAARRLPPQASGDA